jgi:hypothetical protein
MAAPNLLNSALMVDPVFLDPAVVAAQAPPGLVFKAVSKLQATVLSVSADAGAFSGSDSFNPEATISNWRGLGVVTEATGADGLDIDAAAGQSAMPASVFQSVASGLRNSSLVVGADTNTVIASATSNLLATAQTVAAGSIGTDIDAVAVAAQQADGLLDSSVTIGRQGALLGSVVLDVVATASNVGDPTSDGDDAFARIGVDADGVDQGSNQAISIGAVGSVQGQARVGGGALAETVNGSAEVQGDLSALGLSLGSAADITIGAAGDISGLAVIGEWSAANLVDLLDLRAVAVAEDALSSAVLDAAGIRGTDSNATSTPGNTPGSNQTLLTAGPLGGNVVGQAFAGLNTVATTTGDPRSIGATADNSVAEVDAILAGIQDVDILGGMVGARNAITGSSQGVFETFASSVKGDALANSDVSAYGIRDADGDGVINTSGGIQAIATLSNTVVARSVNGNAVAVATGSVVGLSGYSITIMGSGSLVARAESNTSSMAGSVLGGAQG